ncbi:MAG: hypothetical protein ACOX6S_02185 [Clostridia bacterium]
MVGYHKRSDPAMEYAHRLIQDWKSSGEYGKMKLVRITMPPGDWVGGAPKCITSNEAYPSITTEAMPDYFDEETRPTLRSICQLLHSSSECHAISDG